MCVDKVLGIAEVEGILAECVVLTGRVKAVCLAAAVVLGCVEGGDLVVEMSRGLVSVFSLVENVEVSGLDVDVFGVSKSAIGEKKIMV